MVSPDDEANNTNRDHRIGHAEIAEDWFLREGRHNVRDNTESWQNHDVNFRMAEEPEQMLEHLWVTTTGWIKEACPTCDPVREQHEQSGCEDWKGEEKQERCHKNRPRKERHFVKGHTRRTHVQNGRDEVNCTKDRRETGRQKTNNNEIKGWPRMSRGRERGIHHPTAPKSIPIGIARHHETDQQADQSGRQQPEGQIIHTRERHIGRADHNRDKPVPETANQGWHHHEEDHDQSVHRHIDEILMFIGKELNTGIGQFHSHHERQETTNQTRNDTENQIECSDIFMVG